MNKYLKLLARFTKMSVLKVAEYRINFLFMFLIHIAIAAANISFWVAIYSKLGIIQGWKLEDTLIMISFYEFIHHFWSIFLQGSYDTWRDIIYGRIDIHLCRPVDPFFVMLAERISVEEIFDLILTGLIFAGVVTYFSIPLSGWGLMVGGILLFFAHFQFTLLQAAISCTAFWVGKVGFIQTLMNQFWRFTKYPIVVFPTWFQVGLTALFPLTYSETMGALTLLNRIDINGVIAAFVVNGVLLLVWWSVFRGIWNSGLKVYESYGG